LVESHSRSASELWGSRRDEAILAFLRWHRWHPCPPEPTTLPHAVTHLAATRLTADADPARRSRRGRVRSVHRAAIAVDLAPDDETLTIAIDAVGGCPTGLLVRADDLRTFGVLPGMNVMATPDGWQIPDAGLVIDPTGAAVWDAALPSSNRLTPTAELARRAGLARSLVDALARPGGLWPRRDRRTDDPWATAARPLIRELSAALVEGDGEAAADAASRLVGLGVGLTPSGDDFLVGLLAGLEATGNPLRRDIAAAVRSDVNDRTTAAGASAVRQAADGAYSERLHDVLASLAHPAEWRDARPRGDARDGLVRAVVAALAFGETSGSDTIAGLLLAIDAVLAPIPGATRVGAAA
jgi:hypothetical protein